MKNIIDNLEAIKGNIVDVMKKNNHYKTIQAVSFVGIIAVIALDVFVGLPQTIFLALAGVTSIPLIHSTLQKTYLRGLAVGMVDGAVSLSVTKDKKVPEKSGKVGKRKAKKVV